MVRGGLSLAICLLLALPITGSLALDADTGKAGDPIELPASTGPRVDGAFMLAAERTGTRIVAVGERGIALYSDDEGATWKQAAVPVQVTLTGLGFAPNSAHGWAVGHDAVILHTDDAGATWTVQYQAPDWGVPLLDVEFEDERRGIAYGGRGHLLHTRDGGATWQDQTIYGVDEFDGHLFGLLRTGDALVLAAEAGTVQRSTDAGTTWQVIDSGYTGSIFGLLALPSGRLVAYAMLGNVLLSDDGGLSWRRAVCPVKQSFLTGVRLADGRIVLAGRDGGVAVSSDDGESFADYSLPDRRSIADLMQLADGRWISFGEDGIRKMALEPATAAPGETR